MNEAAIRDAATNKPETSVRQQYVHPDYRPDIDGLRAIAIGAVILFHAFPSSVPGGFIGVDVFFVISGYLISTIIFRNLQLGRFSFSDFYIRRIRRIFPALALVLCASLVVGWTLLLPDEYTLLGKHVAASSVFIQNLALRQEAGYFDQAAELKPLLHLWSLAIEEQFYLIFPLLTVAIWKFRQRAFILLVLLLTASFAANVLRISSHRVPTFFLLPTRAWELLMGGLLAYWSYVRAGAIALPQWMQFRHIIILRGSGISFAGRVWPIRDFVSVVGSVLLVLSMLIINKKNAFPGWWALLPTVGATLLILAGQNAFINRRLLSIRPLVYVGLISYPLYLWHWPILSFLHISTNSEGLSAGIRLVAISASFVLAWLTYRYAEQPLRFGPRAEAKAMSLGGVLVLLGGAGYFVVLQSGFSHRLDERVVRVAAASGEWAYPGELVGSTVRGIHFYRMPSDRKATTMFVGDSNIEQYFPRVSALINASPKGSNSVIFKTGGGCLPIPGVRQDNEHKHCATLLADAMVLIKNLPEIDVVVIGAQWNGYLGDGYGLAHRFEIRDSRYLQAMDALQAYIASLRALGKRVYLILNIPIGHQLDPKSMVVRNVFQDPYRLFVRETGIQRVAFETAYGVIQHDLARAAESAGARVISPMDALCTEVCSAVDRAGEPIYKDLSHLRPSFVREHADFIDVTVL